MSYVSAEEILPKELIETIQQYVSGKNIYIPAKEKRSGEARQKQSSTIKHGIRKYIQSIKKEFRQKYLQGSILFL